MSGKRSKEHHYIPKAILRYFCTNDEQLWLSVRGKDGLLSEPERRNIKSVFVEKDYYTVVENGLLSDKVEKEFYSKIDDFLGKFIRFATEALHQGRIASIPSDDEGLLATVLYHMVRRNPEFRPLHSDVEVGRLYFANLIEAVAQLENADALRSKYEEQSQNTLKLLHYGRSIRVKSQLQSSSEVDAALSELQLRWVISKGQHSFVLPANLPYRIGNGRSNGLSNPDFEMWMPITPKIAIALVRDSLQQLPIIYEIGRDHMRHINLFGVSNSQSVASHDKKLLVSLINNR